MATGASRMENPFPAIFQPAPEAQKERLCDLLRLQQAALQINSILDLDQLLDEVVNGIVQEFGCVEAGIMLKDDLRNELVAAAMHGCTIHKKGDRFTIGRDGLVGKAAETGETYYAPDVTLEPSYIRCEPATQSELEIPLRVGENLIGILTVGHPELDAFSAERIEVLEALAAHIAIAVVNARSFGEERRENDRLRFEQQEAAIIQHQLLPKFSPVIPGLKVEAALLPARVVSGDWFDYIPMRDGRWGFVLADVSGKGMSAALLMASVRGSLRAMARQAISPAEVLDHLNQVLIDDLPEERFVTMLFAIFDPQTRELRLANAGHPWPLLSSLGTTRALDANYGPPLGVMDAAYKDERLILDAGSKLLMFSDGITEAEDAGGNEFGSHRLECLVKDEGLKAADVVTAVRRHAGSPSLSDDATVLILKG